LEWKKTADFRLPFLFSYRAKQCVNATRD